MDCFWDDASKSLNLWIRAELFFQKKKKDSKKLRIENKSSKIIIVMRIQQNVCDKFNFDPLNQNRCEQLITFVLRGLQLLFTIKI